MPSNTISKNQSANLPRKTQATVNIIKWTDNSNWRQAHTFNNFIKKVYENSDFSATLIALIKKTTVYEEIPILTLSLWFNSLKQARREDMPLSKLPHGFKKKNKKAILLGI